MLLEAAAHCDLAVAHHNEAAVSLHSRTMMWTDIVL
jgi:hypothetical protein